MQSTEKSLPWRGSQGGRGGRVWAPPRGCTLTPVLLLPVLQGNSALHHAVREGHAAVVTLLLRCAFIMFEEARM